MNFTFIAGNIGKYEGKKVGEDFAVKFSIASSNHVKRGGEWKEVTEWFNCTYWTKSEKVLEVFGKCAGVAVLATRETTKKDDKTFIDYRVSEIQFIFPKKEKDSDEPF